MNTLRLVTLYLASLALLVRAEDAHFPKPGSAERKKICDGLRAYSYFGDLYKEKRSLGKKANTAILCVARRGR